MSCACLRSRRCCDVVVTQVLMRLAKLGKAVDKARRAHCLLAQEPFNNRCRLPGATFAPLSQRRATEAPQ